MATVFLAQDLKHDRSVAIKVLHEELAVALGGERFLAEIRTTARLQHPHILPLLDSGVADGLLYYVMPFVPGESLRDRLQRERQLPLDEALRIAREVADALGHAHGHGIIHRDIKPENILLQEGHALVADFGIALAVQTAGGQRMTQTGLSLGTPQYMSPEQAMGEKAIDARSDVYALGAVTYEMLTGEPPFTGATVQAIVAKVLASEPARPSEVRRTIPAAVEAAVMTALAKLPADRFATAAQFAAALAAGSGTMPALSSGGVARAGAARDAERWRAVAAVSALVALAALGYALTATRGKGGALAIRQYDVALPDSAPIVFAKGSPWGEGWTALRVSPAADFVVYIADRGAQSELWYRSLVDTVARALPGTTGAYQVALSPDGQEVAFIAGNRLRVVPVSGGQARELGIVRRPSGIAWMPDGDVIVTDDDAGLTRYDPVGAQPEGIDGEPCPLPVVASANLLLCSTGILDLSATARGIEFLRDASQLMDSGPPVLPTAPALIGEDVLLYSSGDGAVIGARLSLGQRSLTNRAVVLTGVRSEGVFGARQMDMSPSGTLVYVPGAPNARGQLVRSDGRATRPLPIAPLVASQFDRSPDGTRLAVTVATSEGMELWVHEMANGRGTRLGSAVELAEPRWSPDGTRIAVSAGSFPRNVVLVYNATGSAAPDTLRGLSFYPSHWYVPDRLMGYTGGPNGGLVSVDLSSIPIVRVDTTRESANLSRPVVSPGGTFLAYMVADEVAVQVVGRGSARTTVGRGIDPLWMDVRTLAYRDGATWYRARVESDASVPQRPEPWFSDPLFIDTNLRSHALASSDEVIYLQSTARPTSHFLRVVPGWSDQVRAAVNNAPRR